MWQTEKDYSPPVILDLTMCADRFVCSLLPLCTGVPPYCPVSYPAFAGKTTFKVDPNVVSIVHKVSSKQRPRGRKLCDSCSPSIASTQERGSEGDRECRGREAVCDCRVHNIKRSIDRWIDRQQVARTQSKSSSLFSHCPSCVCISTLCVCMHAPVCHLQVPYRNEWGVC